MGTRCAVNIQPKDGEWTLLTHIFPEDVNRRQSFDLPQTEAIVQMKLVFEESSDFFGRLTIYDLVVEGLNP